MSIILALYFGEGDTAEYLETLRSEILHDTPSANEKDGKQFRLDIRSKIRVTSASGVVTDYLVDTEMQAYDDETIIERINAYHVGMVSEHLKMGDSYNKYLGGVSCLITTKRLDFLKDVPGHLHVFERVHRGDPRVLWPKGGIFVVVELSKFTKSIDEIDGMADAWCYLMKHSEDMTFDDCIKFCEKGEAMEEAVRTVALESMTPEMKALLRAAQASDEALSKAKAKGEAKGEAKGKRETQRSTVVQGLALGLKADIICQLTNLSLAEVQAIAKEG